MRPANISYTAGPHRHSAAPRLVHSCQATNDRFGSHPEELRTSKTSPLRLPKADVERTSSIGCFGPTAVTTGTSSPLRQRLGDFVGTLNKKLRDGTERSAFQGNDPNRQVGHG